MQNFDAYQFFLCLVVFIILTTIFTATVIYVIRVNCKFIDLGVKDDKIKIEYEKKQARKKSILAKVLDKFVLVFFTFVFIAIFGLGVVMSVREDKVVGEIPTLKVVQSGSMSYVNEYNKYLDKEDVTAHIHTFDIVVIHKLPKVEDLKINDIVLYEIDGFLLVHRIVDIELPNSEHPDEIHFLLHGDANELPDKFPVKYEQMKGIYLGKRVPYIGTFVAFMQSPAGYLCILLVIFAIIALPFGEKKIEKRKYARLLALGLIQGENKQESTTAQEGEESPVVVATETAITDADQEESRFGKFGKPKSFEEKLAISGEKTQNAYAEIVTALCRIEKIRAIRGFKGETYRCGNKAVCKLGIRGKTLSVYLALVPHEFENTKYIFEDVSQRKDYASYAMRVKMTSDRQVKWAKELLLILAEKNGLPVAKQPITNIKDLFKSFGKAKTFEQKLKTATPILKERYLNISEFVTSYDKMRVIRGKKAETYRCGNKSVCKLTIRGKTLNVYVGLDPKEYEDTKYHFTDVSDSKTYANYPMRLKMTSDRQVRWAKELLGSLAEKYGFVIVKKPTLPRKPSFHAFKKPKSFAYKLRTSSDLLKARYKEISTFILSFDKTRFIKSKKGETYKKGNTCVCKLTIRGKTLNAYLGLDPKAYENTKYVFTDVSQSKTYANYPMRVKLTSDRQVRWLKELLSDLLGVEGGAK